MFAGKAEVHLSVELDDVPPVTLLPPRASRNGPARQRRREKRAAARQDAEKELPNKGATVEVSAEEPDMNKVTAEHAIIGKSELLKESELTKSVKNLLVSFVQIRNLILRQVNKNMKILKFLK